MNWYKYFNFGTIIFVGIVLILILVDLIPRNLYVPALVLTIIIFIARIVARVIYSMKTKSKELE